MPKAAFTPGPWKLIDEPEYPSLVGIEMSDGEEAGYVAAKSEPEEMANARLIASAPCLLQALNDLAAAVDQCAPDGFWDRRESRDLTEAMAKAEQVLVKARGEG